MTEEMKLVSQRSQDNSTGHVICWGCGEFGQHGHGYRKEVAFLDGAVEQFCGGLEVQVKHAACGASHTAVVTNSNEVYVWGNGNSGQLGCNNVSTKMEPLKVSLYTNQTASPPVAGVACGGRHTMVWMENGHVFGFGNNSHAQLGYDFKEKNYKENQANGFWDDEEDDSNQSVTQPMLLKFLAHRPVTQVACGDKHTVFRFKDGTVSCVGNNAHGQVGTGTQEDATCLKPLDFNCGVKWVATGSQHSMAVTASGEVYVWGFGKACGNKTDDVLSPLKVQTHRQNVIRVAGGSTHSMALTANGSVYTWGCGFDGQLGHGDKVRFLSTPIRIKDRHVTSKCIQISCGETFSAAVTEKGLLYMWGKNSHTIQPGKPTSYKLFLPLGLNKNFRGGRVDRIVCGSWHAIAIIGRPELLQREDASSESEEEIINPNDDMDMEIECVEEQTINNQVHEELDNVIPLDDSDSGSIELPSRLSRREDTKLEREKTTVSLADFYAPTPDINRNLRSPSPEFYHGNTGNETTTPDNNMPESARSTATLVVQLPSQPLTTYADVGCSPMTVTTTTSSTKSSSVTTLSRVPSPIQEMISYRNVKNNRRTLKSEKKFKEFDPQKYERDKLRTTPVVSEVVQFSKTSADAFALPHQPTPVSKKHVDFSEMEEVRLKGPRSPDKLSRLSKHSRDVESSQSLVREHSPGKLRGSPLSKAKHRQMDNSSISFKSDSALMESPLFRGSRNISTSERPIRTSWNGPPIEEERQYKHRVPRQLPRQYSKPKPAESNFGLQISRSKTIIAPLLNDGYDTPDRLSQIRRYASMHNPHSTSTRGTGDGKLRPLKARHVSIPTNQSEAPAEDIDKLYIGSLAGNPTNKTGFNVSSAWKDKHDADFIAPRKVAAGIVRMYVGNTSDLLGSVDNPMYASLSDGRRPTDPSLDEDPLMIQPLMKKRIKVSSDTPDIELPSIDIKQTNAGALTDRLRRSKGNRCLDNEDMASGLVKTSRSEHVLDSRVS